jgi:iron complex outermembrane receptor protein
MRHSILALSISAALGSLPALALAQNASPDDPADLETIAVRALPIERSELDSAEPIEVLAGQALDDRRGMTLGETLANQPGVHSSFYGQGAGRPIIRGLGGPRVRILEDGLSTGDASAPSDDHAVTIDPFLADQIEILRGPATLLYGSDASGGVVNIVDNRIPEQVPDAPLAGRFELRGDTVAEERSGALRLNGGGGSFAWHLDGSWRDADDYDIPGPAEREFGHGEDHDHHDEHDHHDDHDHHDGEGSGTLDNSFVETLSGTIGGSWIGSRGFLGASVRRYETEYGIPAPHSHGGHDHDHGDHDDHDMHDDHDEDHDHEHEDHGDDEGMAFIDMEQTSWDIKGQLDDPLPGFTRARIRLGYNDYRHREIEVEEEGHGEHDHDDEHDHEPTQFDVETYQARLELRTEPVAGWEGAIGVQYDQEDFVAAGEEAFVPPNETDAIALFLLQEQQFGNVNVSFGARLEQTEISADLPAHDDHDHEHDHDHGHEHEEHGHDDHHEHEFDFDFDRDSRKFTNWSASLGAVWQMSERWQSSISLARSQRAPSATELFSNGPHLATFSFEVGNPDLNRETTLSWDLGLHRHSDFFDFDIDLFYKQVDDFIYLAETGEEVDGFDLRLATQEDAELYGLETQATWKLRDTAAGNFDLTAGYDMVRGELDAGGNLPRISPQRVTAGVDWFNGPWRAGVGWQRVFRQDEVAEFETETPGYNLVNARLAYAFNVGTVPMEAYISGQNLGDNEARVHTSFLRDFSPLPGRNFRVGIRGEF